MLIEEVMGVVFGCLFVDVVYGMCDLLFVELFVLFGVMLFFDVVIGVVVKLMIGVCLCGGVDCILVVVYEGGVVYCVGLLVGDMLIVVDGLCVMGMNFDVLLVCYWLGDKVEVYVFCCGELCIVKLKFDGLEVICYWLMVVVKLVVVMKVCEVWLKG